MSPSSALPIVLVSAGLALPLLALTPVEESFNSSKLNPTRWYHYQQGNGALAPAAKSLGFTVTPKGTDFDFASIELLTSQPGYSESWEMTLDLANTGTAGKKAGGGIMIFNVGDRNDYLFLETYGRAGGRAGILVDGMPAKVGSLPLGVGVRKGGIKITFDHNRGLMTFYASATTAKKGYDFIEIGSFSPTGKGGDVRANWKMNSGSRFGIQLFGFGHGRKIPKNTITFDNFSLQALE